MGEEEETGERGQGRGWEEEEKKRRRRRRGPIWEPEAKGHRATPTGGVRARAITGSCGQVSGLSSLPPSVRGYDTCVNATRRADRACLEGRPRYL